MEKEGRGNFYFGKKGQVTLFIIIAIVIVGLGILIYFLFPQVQVFFGATAENPNDFLQSCVGEDLNSIVEELSSQGGTLQPENYYLFDNSEIEYLCYTNEYYLTCVVQKPLLKQSIEREIQTALNSKVSQCFDEMVKEFKGKGFDVNFQEGDFKIELLPKRVVLTSDSVAILNKDGQRTVYGSESEQGNKIRVVLNNNLYELVSIAQSIVGSEATYGDAETTTYMNYYRDLKVEKYKQTSGTTIYVLTDRNTGSQFQFASRSVAWPPGFG